MYKYVLALFTRWSADVPSHVIPDRWALYLPAAFLLIVALWWAGAPSYPGCCLAGATFCALVVIARARISPVWEKTFWFAMITFLLIVEACTAYTAHLAVGNYLVLQLTPESGGFVKEFGTRPVRMVTMHVIDFDKITDLQNRHIVDTGQYEKVVEHIPVGEFVPGSRPWFAFKHIQPETGLARYRIVFTSENGMWWQDLLARKVGQQILQAYIVQRYQGLRSRVLLRHVDLGFSSIPVEEMDWSWASHAP